MSKWLLGTIFGIIAMGASMLVWVDARNLLLMTLTGGAIIALSSYLSTLIED